MGYWKNLIAGFLSIIIAYGLLKLLLWILGAFVKITLGLLSLVFLLILALPVYAVLKKMLKA